MMEGIEDLKNYILAIDKKLNNLFTLMSTVTNNNQNMNEVINMIHNLGLERYKQNKVLFESAYPDLMRRMADIESVQRKEEEKNREKLLKEIKKLARKDK